MGARRKYDWDSMADGTLQYADFEVEDLVVYANGRKPNGDKRAPRLRGEEQRLMSACRTYATRADLALRLKRGGLPDERKVRVWWQFLPRGEEARFAALLADEMKPPPVPARDACPLCGLAGCDCNELGCGRCAAVGSMGVDGRCTAEWPEGSGRACGETIRY